MSISFVVPAFNEEKSISELFRLVSDITKSVEYKVSLLIIENGSFDSTRNEIIRNSQKNQGLNLKVIQLDSNIGYGGAMKCGIVAADSSVVALLPADGKYELSDIKGICDKYMVEYDKKLLVKGYRVARNDPSFIQFLSATLTQIANLLFKTSSIDVNGLPKIFHKSLILDSLSTVPDDACFDVGLLALWRRSGGGIYELPVRFTQINLNQTSWAGKRIKTSLRMLVGILKFFLKSRGKLR